MPLIIHELKLPLTEEAEESSFKTLAARTLALSEDSILSLRVLRKSIDARKKNEICFRYTLEIELSPKDESRVLKKQLPHVKKVEPETVEAPLCRGGRPLKGPMVVVGLGPAGLFAAYRLAEYGYKPIVIERGKPVEERKQDVARFWAKGVLDTQSNLMYGEGGAGTFSDGKLTTRIKDARVQAVLELLVRFGAPEEILVLAKPHIGTDLLSKTVSNMRRGIEEKGGEVLFNTCLSGLEIDENDTIQAIRVLRPGRPEERIPCGACVLGIGQGARGSYRMLQNNGLELLPKAFAVGFRIEHPRALIDTSQYGSFAGHPKLGAAEYHLSEQVEGRGVYSFCMCPGGLVVAASSGEGEVVTNGMSYYTRDAENSNAAIVVQVDGRDYGKAPLDGLLFQERLERAAFLAGGGGYIAPASRVCDFLRGDKPQSFGGVRPSYRPGVIPSDLRACLPSFVAAPLAAGIRAFGRRLKGFDMEDAVLTAVETRTSAPLRICRNETGEATRCSGLYPVGEGAGYAGGIVSAAVDGVRAAERIIGKYYVNE